MSSSSSASSSGSAAPAPKKLTLKSSDGEKFVVGVNAAIQSQLLKHMVEGGCADAVIPLPNVAGGILATVIEFCKKQVEFSARAAADGSVAAAVESQRMEWNARFVKVELPKLYDLIRAANYLNIQSLLDAACGEVGGIIIGKTPEQIRDLFNIPNDYTAEEEADIRRDTHWAYK